MQAEVLSEMLLLSSRFCSQKNRKQSAHPVAGVESLCRGASTCCSRIYYAARPDAP